MSTQESEIDPTWREVEEGSRALRMVYHSLPGWFNTRSALIEQQKLHPADPTLDVELDAAEQGLSEVLGVLRHTKAIEIIAYDLLAQGVIDSRGDLLRIAARYYDSEDLKSPEVSEPIPMLCLVGDMACGKGTVGEILETQYGFRNFPISDRLREMASQKAILPPYPRELLRGIDETLRGRFGDEVCMRWTMDAVERKQKYYQSIGVKEQFPGAVIDGIRNAEGTRYFQARPNTAVLAIIAHPDTRFKRLVERARPGDDTSRETFDATDRIEGARIRPLIELADARLINEGAQEDLGHQVVAFMQDRFHLQPRLSKYR